MKNQLKPIPKFNSEEEEYEFWQNNDTADFIDWEGLKKLIFSEVKPSGEMILE